MSISHFVEGAFDQIEKGHIYPGLALACSAVDGTIVKEIKAQNPGANLKKHNSHRFKSYVNEYMYPITACGFRHIIAQNIRLGVGARTIPGVTPDKSGSIGFDDVIYSIIRCSVTHECSAEDLIEFSDDCVLSGFNPRATLPKSIVFGILGAAILNPINQDERIDDRYGMFVEDRFYRVNDLWGKFRS